MALLEICCSDIQSVEAAARGGADRIELCSALESGGLTPSRAMIEAAVGIFGGPVHVLVRPRSGDFLYTPAEKRLILREIRDAVSSGASGIVCGVLTSRGDIDEKFLEEMIKAADNASFTFHRAFDLTRSPLSSLDVLMSHGVKRLLTSGCAQNAEKGIPLIKELCEKSKDNPIIMAGAGITENNALRVISRTGVKEIHSTCKVQVASKMEFRRREVNMGCPGEDEYSRYSSSENKIRRLKTLLNSNN